MNNHFLVDKCTKNSSFSEVGKIISQQRNRSGISLKALSSKLKLRYDVIEMIELGNIDLIDKRINIFGYVSLISKELGLNHQVILSKMGFCDEIALEKRTVKNIKDRIDQISYLKIKTQSNLKENLSIKEFLNDQKVRKILMVSLLILGIIIYKTLL